jgi:hypothetical protein
LTVSGPADGDDKQPEDPRTLALGYAARYSRYAGIVAVVVLAALFVITVLHRSNSAAGVAPGEQVPPFAVPLATSRLEGDANVATRAHEGEAGKVPACSVRAPAVLNICQQYESHPVVLALFINGGGCRTVVGQLDALSREFPHVNFAAVAIRGDRGALRTRVLREGWRIPVGYDRDGVLASLYRVATCPQVSFIYPGGAVQSKSLLGTPSLAQLRARVQALEGAARRRSAAG